jgi:hypothetical protein
MNPNLISQLVELAISLAQTQLDSGDTEPTLLDIVHKSVQAYKDHTGESLKVNLIRKEKPL